MSNHLSAPVFGAVVAGCVLNIVGSVLFMHFGQLAYNRKNATIVRVKVNSDGVMHSPPGSTEDSKLDVADAERDLIFADVAQYTGKHVYVVMLKDKYARYFTLEDTDMRVTNEIALKMPRSDMFSFLWSLIGIICISSVISLVITFSKSGTSKNSLFILGLLFCMFVPTPFFFGFANDKSVTASMITLLVAAVVSLPLVSMNLMSLGDEDSEEDEPLQ
jgi:hypothetical protein